MEKTLRQRILQIKAICKDQALPATKVIDMVYESGKSVSDRTIRKLLAEGSEEMSFQYDSVIKVYEVLIDRFGDTPDVQDIEILRRMITERDKQIDRLMIECEKRDSEYGERYELYADRKNVYEKTIEILHEQIKFKDEEIRRKDELLDMLVESYIGKMK